jgi:hypothetical protein
MHSVVLNSRLLSLTAGKGKGLSALHEGYLTVWDSSMPCGSEFIREGVGTSTFIRTGKSFRE